MQVHRGDALPENAKRREPWLLLPQVKCALSLEKWLKSRGSPQPRPPNGCLVGSTVSSSTFADAGSSAITSTVRATSLGVMKPSLSFRAASCSAVRRSEIRHVAGVDRAHADVVRPAVEGEALRQPAQRKLGRGVRGRARPRAEGSQRADVDDAAARTVPSPHHVLESLAGAHSGANHVRLKRRAQVLRGERFRRSHLHDARRADEQRTQPAPLLDLREQAADGRIVGHVARNGRDAVTARRKISRAPAQAHSSMLAAVCLSVSADLPEMTTCSPLRKSARAMAEPMAPVAPVTTAMPRAPSINKW